MGAHRRRGTLLVSNHPPGAVPESEHPRARAFSRLGPRSAATVRRRLALWRRPSRHTRAVERVVVEPNSVIRLVESGRDRHRLSLERGQISARLWSPPFVFSFATPAAVLTDLGCAFTLEVGRAGEDIVHVTSGWVEFEWDGRQELIPAGATAIAVPGAGPGTAFFDDASEELKSALREINFGPADHRQALERALRSARPRDVYSLLRLSIRLRGEERGLIYDRASQLVPPPSGVTRQAFIDRESGVLDSWVDSLGLGNAKRWWVHWRDVL